MRIIFSVCLAMYMSVCFPALAWARRQVGDAPVLLDQSLDGTGISRADVSTTAGTIIEGVLGAVGLVFFVLMFYGGMLWLIARGNDEQIAKAKRVIVSAVIGLVVTISAYAITNFITSRFTG